MSAAAAPPPPLPDPARWAGRRVLLTGHTGFKGGWLGLWLQALGAEVTGLALAAEPASLGARLAGSVPGAPADLRDAGAVAAAVAAARPEMIFHLAAQALVRRGYAQPAATFATNLMGTVNLLEAAGAAPDLRAVLVVTTDKVYANRETSRPYHEQDPLGGDDPYAASKACAEIAAGAWARAFLGPRGVRLATARAGNVIGGGDQGAERLVPDCLAAFAAGRPVRLRNPAATRPWQHVLDPLCGYLLLAEALLDGRETSGAWNFGPAPGPPVTVGEVAQRLAARWGGGARVVCEAPGAEPPEARLLALDSAKARTRLGWRPRLDLRAALDWILRWPAVGPAAPAMLADIDAYGRLGAAASRAGADA